MSNIFNVRARSNWLTGWRDAPRSPARPKAKPKPKPLAVEDPPPPEGYRYWYLDQWHYMSMAEANDIEVSGRSNWEEYRFNEDGPQVGGLFNGLRELMAARPGKTTPKEPIVDGVSPHPFALGKQGKIHFRRYGVGFSACGEASTSHGQMFGVVRFRLMLAHPRVCRVCRSEYMRLVP